jgi:hypothetical protein
LAAAEPPRAKSTALRFEVSVAPSLLSTATDGRILVAISRNAKVPPRRGIGQTGMTAGPLLGADAKALASGAVVVLDQNAAIFPLSHLSDLPAGRYAVQAVFAHNRDLNLPGAPGNLYSDPTTVTLDAAKGGTIPIELTKAVPAEELPTDTEQVKFIRLRSELQG